MTWLLDRWDLEASYFQLAEIADAGLVRFERMDCGGSSIAGPGVAQGGGAAARPGRRGCTPADEAGRVPSRGPRWGAPLVEWPAAETSYIREAQCAAVSGVQYNELS